MSSKKLILAIALIGLVALALSAQSADVPTFSIENGFETGYSFSANNIGSGFDLTLAYGITDKVAAMLSYVVGDGAAFPSYRLFGLAYSFAPKLGLSTWIGQNTAGPTVVAGLGLYSNLISRAVAGSLQTGLKLRLDYLAPTTSISSGFLRIGFITYIGM